MNKLSKLDTTKIEVNYTNLAKKYYNTDETSVSEYVSKLAKQSAANSNEPGRVTFFANLGGFCLKFSYARNPTCRCSGEGLEAQSCKKGRLSLPLN